jgi:hypothetical protein
MRAGTKSGVSTIILERLQCARRDSAGPTERRRRRDKTRNFAVEGIQGVKVESLSFFKLDTAFRKVVRQTL